MSAMDYLTEFPEFASKMVGYIPYNAPEDMYEFERNFDEKSWNTFVAGNWKLTLYVSAIYVALVFAGKHYMKDRPKFELRLPLAAWSASLAIFSILGTIRVFPELLSVVRRFGFEESVCNPSYTFLSSGSFGFWKCLFLVSKVFELGDTAFIVLRKQKLIFLHWYHHITVMIYCWWAFSQWTPAGRWFMVMNYSVHSVMYTYYTCRALRIPVPKQINLVITSMQLLQMVMGLVMVFAATYYKSLGHLCLQSNLNLLCTFLMYFSYFALFANFFYNAYIKPKAKEQQKLHENGHSSATNGDILAKHEEGRAGKLNKFD